MKNRAPNKSIAALPRQHGFTLIEVMVALIIFGICAVSLQQVLSMSVNSFEKIERKTFAGWIAENRLAEIRLQPQMPAVGESKSDLEYAGRDWNLKTLVTATQDPNMRRVDVDVYLHVANRLDDTLVTTLTGFIGKN